MKMGQVTSPKPKIRLEQLANYPFDEETREGIQQSYRDKGALKPVIIAESPVKEINGLPADGFHRLSIDPDWPLREYKKVNDWREYYQLRFQSNIQHMRDHPQQLKRDLNAYCAKLAEMGVGKQNCAERAIEHLQLGYNPNYLRTLIDPQYKDQARAEAGSSSSVMMTPEEEEAIRKKEKAEAKEKSKHPDPQVVAAAKHLIQLVRESVPRKQKCQHCGKFTPVQFNTPKLEDLLELNK